MKYLMVEVLENFMKDVKYGIMVLHNSKNGKFKIGKKKNLILQMVYILGEINIILH